MNQEQAVSAQFGARQGCLPFILFMTLLSCSLFLFFGCFLSSGLFLMMKSVQQEHPDEYREFTHDVLGVSAGSAMERFYLSDEQRGQVEELGYDPDLVARALATEVWADAQWGEGAGDAAIYIALTNGESANCTNAGGAFALTEMRKRGFYQNTVDFDTLHEIWKRNDIQNNPNSFSSNYMNPDYDPEKVEGSKGAGAIGCSQFMPSTAIMHLDNIGEPFDLWDKSTAMLVMASEVHRLGWRKDANIVKKIQVLMGWNAHRPWITSIVNTAETLRGTTAGMSAIHDVVGQSTGFKAGMLRILDLMPTANQYDTMFAGPGNLKQFTIACPECEDEAKEMAAQFPVTPHSLGSNAQDHIDRNSVAAWDFSAEFGAPVYPIMEGHVEYIGCNNAGGYGCWARVIHANGYMTYYAHLQPDSLNATAGDQVGKDSLLGNVGATGKTSWSHTHVEIWKNGHRIDPADFFGDPSQIGLEYIFWTKLPAEYKY